MLRVLHLASFSGNIGDNANHMGFRPWFEHQIQLPIEWVNLEIREFYWKERCFDQGFVDLVNSFDALVIGGGNYFELWVEDSPTGTSIAIEPALFAAIHVPVLFNALGVDPGLGVPDSSHTRFKAFLDQILSSDQYLLSVRNDGAIDALETYFGDDYAAAAHHVPDGGFFMQRVDRLQTLSLDKNYRNIGINLANDISDVRYADYPGDNKSAAFAEEFASAISRIATIHADTKFILFPHIFRDLDIINQTLLKLDDRLRRTRVTVAPYGTGDNAAKVSFGMYQQCNLVVGTRFHSNVCAMAAAVPTIGINSYRQIEMLYRELEIEDRLIDVKSPGFADALVQKLEHELSAKGDHREKCSDVIYQVTAMRDNFAEPFRKWASSIEPTQFRATG